MSHDKAYFGAWQHETLAQFAAEQSQRNVELEAAAEHYRLDLRTAMNQLRELMKKKDLK